jgi:hypothetical protein
MKYYYIRGSGWTQDTEYLLTFIQGRSNCDAYYNLGFRIIKLAKK